jgi:serine/threonine protein kinase
MTYHSTASRENINHYFNIGKIVGHGSYGVVKIATEKNTNNRNKKYAVKSIAKLAIHDKLHLLKRELELMR